jgi:hypothetical protein
MRIDWTGVLKQAGIPDRPGYQELLQQMQQERKQRLESNEPPPVKGGSRKRRNKPLKAGKR